jgi:uroporphyrinogen decarboxylase
MTSIQRVAAAVSFAPVDRIPVIAQVGGHTASIAGYSLDKYLHSGEVAAKSQIAALKHYGYDAVIAIFDACVETEAAGSQIVFRNGLYPIVTKYAIERDFEPSSLKVPDPTISARMPELLKEIGILRNEVGNHTPVVGTAVGPMTVATQLVGLESALYMAADEPDKFELLIDYASEIVISFATAQMQAGAHLILLFDPSASPVVVPSSFYREVIMPRHKKVFDAIKNAGSLANWLHIAGPVVPIMSYFEQVGVTIANFDYQISPEDAQKALPRTCLDGNIKPMSFVMDDEKSVYEDARRVIERFKTRGGFILSSGCEIPPESKPQNIHAMVAAARA